MSHMLFTPEVAERTATEMTQHDLDGWTYRAVHDPKGTGWSYIEITDESGEVVGKL